MYRRTRGTRGGTLVDCARGASGEMWRDVMVEGGKETYNLP